ncbi:MAG TPA: MFS transporter [Crenalkalicoccus sp.]|jgi:DHA1 family tetracycline resistance protein-like MFS transporter|nr:MFS transporter [Crenalkalicoccus sp.]
MRGSRAAIGFIMVTVAVEVLSFGLIIPVLPQLVESFTGGDTADAARWYGLFGTAWALMQFLCMPLAGALSDRFGRRPVVLAGSLGIGLDYVLMAVAPNLWWLLVGRVISGALTATVSTAFAYIADVTPAERRAQAFGTVGVAFGAGFVLGPALGGLLGAADPRLPFWVAAALALVNFAYGALVLPESLPPERRAALSLGHANPLGALGLLRARPGLLGLAGVHFLRMLAHVVLPSVTVLYAGYRYGWGPREIGLMLAGVGVCAAVVQGALVGPVVARIGEWRALLAGLGCGAAGLLGLGLAPSGLLFCAAIPVMAFGDLAGPAMQGLATRRVEPSEQGRLQGAFGSLQGIAGLIGPGLFTLAFAAAIAPGAGFQLPGAPFLLAALLLLAGLGLAAATAPEG